MNKDSLGDRMKQYENVPKNQLMRRQPVIIRIDGKAFHTFTRGFKRPFDDILIKSMQETMKYLCENIQGCKIGYCQSDEISLLLTDYENINTAAWFDYQVQKMCSIAASMATFAFNRVFSKTFYKWGNENLPDWDMGGTNKPVDEKLIKLCNIYESASEKGAMFDARCFSIPKEEVCNYFIWRQMDCTRNSINMVAQTNFSHKELQGKSCNEMQNMLLTKRNINWNDFSTPEKRGSCCIKDGISQRVDMKTNQISTKNIWRIDYDIPIFGDNREYIEHFI